MNQNHSVTAAFWTALLVLMASPIAHVAHAGDLVAVSVDDVERASGSNFIDLVDDVLSQEGDFEDLESRTEYAISLDYLGISDAIQIDAEDNGRRITLRIPSTGLSKVFVGTSADDVEDQVEDFFEESGSDELAEFLEEVNGRSPIAVVDGNPRSTTALLARSAYDRFGFGVPRSRAGYDSEQVADWGHFDMKVEVTGGTIDVDGFNGLSVVDGAITLAGDFNPGVGVSFSILGQYRDYDGADVYDLGFEFGVPVHLRVPDPESPLRWSVAPFIQVGAGVAIDLAAGGLMVGGGLVNSVSYNLGAFEVTMANELAYYGGVPIKDVGGYEFDTELDRLVLRNGGKVTYYDSSGAYAEAGVSLTNLVVADAAIDAYGTPFIGVGIQFGIVGLRVGWESDLGDDYSAHLGTGEIAFQF